MRRNLFSGKLVSLMLALFFSLLGNCSDRAKSTYAPALGDEEPETRDVFIAISIDYKLDADDGPKVTVTQQSFLLNAYLLQNNDEELPIKIGDFVQEPAVGLPLTLEETHLAFEAVLRIPVTAIADRDGYTVRFTLSEQASELPLQDAVSASATNLVALKGGIDPDKEAADNKVVLSLASTLSYKLASSSGIKGKTALQRAAYTNVFAVLAQQFKAAEALIAGAATPNLGVYSSAVLLATKFGLMKDLHTQSNIVSELEAAATEGGPDLNATAACVDGFTAEMKAFAGEVKAILGDRDSDEYQLFQPGAIDVAAIPDPQEYSNVVYAPRSLTFTDSDTSSDIGGSLVLTPPAFESGIGVYHVYFGGETIAQGKLGLFKAVNKGGSPLQIPVPAGTKLGEGVSRFWVFPVVAGKELTLAASVVISNTGSASLQLPLVPSSLVALGGANQVTLSWDALDQADAYHLYWSTTSPVSTSNNKLNQVSSPYTHTGLTAGTTYYYSITSVLGAYESSLSEETFATTASSTVVASYNLTFDANGGSGSMAAQSISSGSAANLRANAFTKLGAIFAGWATSPSGSVDYSDGQSYTMGSSDAILYAQWTSVYTITFDANGGSGSMASQTIASGASAALTANAFTKASSSFAGWATSSTGGITYNDGQFLVMGASDITLYAKWANTSDLLVNYKFDSQSCADSAGSNNCTASNITYVSDGNGGYAASLNGSSSYIALPDSIIKNNSNFTIMLRFKATASQYGSLLGYQNAEVGSTPSEYVPMLVIRSDGKLRGELWTGSQLEVVSSGAVNDGNWHTAYFSATSGSIKLFLDGVAIGTNSGTVQHLSMNANQIGVSRATGRTLMPNSSGMSNNWFYFTGIIDDFYMYSSAL